MRVEPYLFFNGRSEEAIEFYGRAIGAEVLMLMRFKDAPPQPPSEGCPPPSPENADKILHAALRVGATTVMLSDGNNEGTLDFRGFALSLDARDPADAKRLFDALADGGTTVLPLGPSFFSPSFGMVTDRFGVMWMVIVPQENTSQESQA